MSRGFRLTLQLIAALATAAAVARATESARRAFTQAVVDPPRHRALTRSTGGSAPSAPKHLDTNVQVPTVSPTPHPFGPARAIPCRGIESPTTDVIELEASGELDDAASPTERLLARRHAGELA